MHSAHGMGRSSKRQRERRAFKKRQARRKKRDECNSTPAVNLAASTDDLSPSISVPVSAGTDSRPSPSRNSPASSSGSLSPEIGYTRGESSPPVKKQKTSGDTMEGLREELLRGNPLILLDEKRSLEVHIQPELQRRSGSEVLRLSTEEYFRRLHRREMKSTHAIACLTNRVEELKKELIKKEQAANKEKNEAVRHVRKFWRNIVLEESQGGKMLKKSLMQKPC